MAPIVKYETVRYNLTPLVEGPFVGYGDEVDKAWDSIANDMGDQMISEEELNRLGLPKNSLKVKDPKTGKEGYRAAVEVFHQLHCLNLLRQYVYKDYYVNIYSDIQEEEQGLKGHVGTFGSTSSPTNLLPQFADHVILVDRSLYRGHPNQSDVHGRHWHLHLPRIPRVRLRGRRLLARLQHTAHLQELRRHPQVGH